MKRNLPPVRALKIRKPAVIPPPPFPQREGNDNNQEVLTGSIQGMKASAPEERLGNALAKSKKVQGFQFRRTIAAPRGLPGWKELDYLVSSFGLLYAIEVDTAFTHREKHEADRLHDAIVLNALNAEALNVYPRVIHLDGDSDLADAKAAETTVTRMFG